MLPAGAGVSLREVSVVSPLTLLLLGGSLQVQHEGGTVLLDAWLQVRGAGSNSSADQTPQASR